MAKLDELAFVVVDFLGYSPTPRALAAAVFVLRILLATFDELGIERHARDATSAR